MTAEDARRDGADLDPDIRRFMDITAAAYAEHPALDGLPLPEARQVFEAVRTRWRTGGPVMAATLDDRWPTRHGQVRVRVHRPTEAGPGPAPALVYLHGGGWTIFSIDTHDRLMREYAARAGVVVVGVDYALSPEARFPVALEQVLDVVDALRRDGASVGVDPERLAIGGDSAGGNLSLAAALALRDGGAGEVLSGLLLNYPVLDRHVAAADGDRFGGPAYMLSVDEMETFWANYLSRPQDADDPLANPARAELAGLPPVFLTIAECDVLAGQGHAAAARLVAAGVPVEARVYAGASHSFLEAVSIAPLAERALAEGAAWLRARLAP
ncbi:alpha/beta hydrolase [Phenylobacterium deserti]|uniref:Alpha/beta hydrolase n=2 Tax=Phenylobacterium deserti TaxID=1914756 RepID=A0A328AAF2_9CAUL|nr:alpha/beta hydrolase [Phenylobacterium deserti]